MNIKLVQVMDCEWGYQSVYQIYVWSDMWVGVYTGKELIRVKEKVRKYFVSLSNLSHPPLDTAQQDVLY